MSIASNLEAIRQRIHEVSSSAGRDPSDIRLIAVSKTRTLQEVESAIEAGALVFGENTIQDALSKIPQVNNEDVEWHFIGHLQSKKAKQIPGHFQWLHTLDSIKLAQKLSAAMTSAELPPLNCLIQVNVSGEASKSGVPMDVLEDFCRELTSMALPGLRLRGLMTIGVHGDDQATRMVFHRLAESMPVCANILGVDDFDQLSMGMSGDYAIAIEEGATMIRIGTDIFGVRK